jgi:hypothetical protein
LTFSIAGREEKKLLLQTASVTTKDPCGTPGLIDELAIIYPGEGSPELEAPDSLPEG